MPKAEKGTPKDIAKRIKSKGLQKLKFYCQMCEKQCRDANGFKCHMTSESHLRQMKIFSENAKGIMDRYSREFETSYLQTLRQRHTTKRVNANNVYQEVIGDKQHIHMNSTRWATLTDFVMYLGKTGKCVVDETERGWYVQYIENDAGVLARKEAQERRAEAEKTAEIAQAQRMEQQRIEAAKMLDRVGGSVHLEATKLERSGNEESHSAISVTLKTDAARNSKRKSNNASNKVGFFDDDDDDDQNEDHNDSAQPTSKSPAPGLATKNSAAASGASSSKKVSVKRPADHKDNDTANISLKRQRHGNEAVESRAKHQKESISGSGSNSKGENEDDTHNYREEPWLKRGIVVRIITKKLANGKYFRRKAVVDRVLKEDKFTAEVEVLDSDPDKRDGGDILRLDQNDLETVVPKEGKRVRILKNDQYRGKKAKVVSLDKKKYRATLKVEEDGTVLEKVDFENFSQLS